jgi:hypothetical protein
VISVCDVGITLRDRPWTQQNSPDTGRLPSQNERRNRATGTIPKYGTPGHSWLGNMSPTATAERSAVYRIPHIRPITAVRNCIVPEAGSAHLMITERNRWLRHGRRSASWG